MFIKEDRTDLVRVLKSCLSSCRFTLGECLHPERCGEKRALTWSRHYLSKRTTSQFISVLTPLCLCRTRANAGLGILTIRMDKHLRLCEWLWLKFSSSSPILPTLPLRQELMYPRLASHLLCIHSWPWTPDSPANVLLLGWLACIAMLCSQFLSFGMLPYTSRLIHWDRKVRSPETQWARF